MTNEQAIKFLNKTFSDLSAPTERAALIFASENIIEDDIEVFLARKHSDLMEEMVPYIEEAYERHIEEAFPEYKQPIKQVARSMMLSIDSIIKYVQMHEKLTEVSESER